MAHFIGCFITFIFIGLNATAQDACYDLVNPLATEVLPIPSRFTVRSILPKAFVADVEAAHGPLNIKIEQFKGVRAPYERVAAYFENKNFYKDLEKTHTGLSILITVGKNLPVLKFQIAFKNDAPHIGEVFYLELTNPMVANNPEGLHQIQNRKGIPFHVLMETKNRLYSYLLSHGIRNLSIHATSDYTVSILYRRFFGFAPATPQSQEIFNRIDRLLTEAKKLNADLRPKSIDDFSRSLADHSSDGQSFETAYAELLKYHLGHKLKPTTRMINNDKGQLFAIVLDYGLPTQLVRYFVEDRLLNWRQITTNRSAELNLSLIP